MKRYLITAAIVAASLLADTAGSVSFDATRGPADAAQHLLPYLAGASLSGQDFLWVYAKASNQHANWLVYTVLCDGMQATKVETREVTEYGNSALFVVESGKACRVWVDAIERREFSVPAK